MFIEFVSKSIQFAIDEKPVADESIFHAKPKRNRTTSIVVGEQDLIVGEVFDLELLMGITELFLQEFDDGWRIQLNSQMLL